MSFIGPLLGNIGAAVSYIAAGAGISYFNSLTQEEKGSLLRLDYRTFCVIKLDSSYNSKISKIILNDPFSLTHHKKEYVEFKQGRFFPLPKINHQFYSNSELSGNYILLKRVFEASEI